MNGKKDFRLVEYELEEEIRNAALVSTIEREEILSQEVDIEEAKKRVGRLGQFKGKSQGNVTLAMEKMK